MTTIAEVQDKGPTAQQWKTLANRLQEEAIRKNRKLARILALATALRHYVEHTLDAGDRLDDGIVTDLVQIVEEAAVEAETATILPEAKED